MKFKYVSNPIVAMLLFSWVFVPSFRLTSTERVAIRFIAEVQFILSIKKFKVRRQTFILQLVYVGLIIYLNRHQAASEVSFLHGNDSASIRFQHADISTTKTNIGIFQKYSVTTSVRFC